jgi:hypothetical protein
MHFDDAYDVLVKYLAEMPDSDANARVGQNQGHGGDLWIPYVVQGYWRSLPEPVASEELEDGHFQPFYDAAWELCRIGVIRPGEFSPRGWSTDAGLFSGDTFSITRFGRLWLKDVGQRPIADPGRLSHVLQGFGQLAFFHDLHRCAKQPLGDCGARPVRYGRIHGGRRFGIGGSSRSFPCFNRGSASAPSEVSVID